MSDALDTKASYTFLCDIRACPSCDATEPINHHSRCTKPADQRVFNNGICDFVESKPQATTKKRRSPKRESVSDNCPVCGEPMNDGSTCDECGLEL